MTQRKLRPPATPKPTGQFSGIQIMFAAILAIGLFLAIDFSGRITASQPLLQAYERVRQEIDSLRLEQAALIQERDYVRSDAYVAQWARSEGRMILPGELLVIPVPSGADAIATPAPATPLLALDPEPQQASNWRLWWDLFFDMPPPQP